MIAIWSTPAALENFEHHGPGNHISSCQVLRIRCVALHEPLTVLVNEVATFTTTTLGDQGTRTVYAGRVKLPHFHILSRHARPERHTHAVTGVNVCVGGGCVDPPGPARRKDGRF